LTVLEKIMKWIDRITPVSGDAVKRAIRTRNGLRAGKEPSRNNGWIWIRVQTAGKKIIACEKARDCNSTERQILNDLLRGEIVCRMVPTKKGGTSWALASIK
jgi:hypothetical protein